MSKVYNRTGESVILFTENIKPWRIVPKAFGIGISSNFENDSNKMSPDILKLMVVEKSLQKCYKIVVRNLKIHGKRAKKTLLNRSLKNMRTNDQKNVETEIC